MDTLKDQLKLKAKLNRLACALEKGGAHLQVGVCNNKSGDKLVCDRNRCVIKWVDVVFSVLSRTMITRMICKYSLVDYFVKTSGFGAIEKSKSGYM